ncbi:hypothetical protein [Algoriphagus sp.]|uniref:hypothetical protein n=1 Tax=Algoriphagus sp. TaxID=1872435 RepID=UPI0025EBA35A|nr:hypothetical protein [Algoriphagus sp.]
MNQENLYHWNNLFALGLILLGIFAILKVSHWLAKRYLRQNKSGKRVTRILKRLSLFYVPIAWGILIVAFISIDYIRHGLLIGAGFILTFPYLKHYISGLFLRENPMIQIGAVVQGKKLKGLIHKIGALGLVLGTSTGEHFIWHGEFEQSGFSVIPPKSTTRLQSIYLQSQLSKKQILDLLFDQPILAFSKPIDLRATKKDNLYVLQYTLEKGAKTEDLVSFLSENNISSSLTENFE